MIRDLREKLKAMYTQWKKGLLNEYEIKEMRGIALDILLYYETS